MFARCRTEAFRLLLAVLAHGGADAACAEVGSAATSSRALTLTLTLTRATASRRCSAT